MHFSASSQWSKLCFGYQEIIFNRKKSPKIFTNSFGQAGGGRLAPPRKKYLLPRPAPPRGKKMLPRSSLLTSIWKCWFFVTNKRRHALALYIIQIYRSPSPPSSCSPTTSTLAALWCPWLWTSTRGSSSLLTPSSGPEFSVTFLPWPSTGV